MALDLEWLKKRAKRVLKELRTKKASAKLADAQLAVARERGFSSWRALVEHVNAARVVPAAALPEETVAQFLRDVGVGDVAKVKAALAETPGLVNATGPHPFWGGRPQPLHVAIDTDRYEMFELLLRAGADVNGNNAGYSHWSPLLGAIGKKRGRMKRALLKRGAKIGLAEALALGDDEAVLKMLRKGRAALPANVPNDGSLLAFARTPAAIDRLLALGVPADTKDRWGSTPMDALSRAGRSGAPLVRHLHARGVPVNAEVFAHVGDRKTLARIAVDDPSVVTDPLVIKAAVDFGHRALVRWLLDRGADPNARSNRESRDTCLHSAAWNGDLEMVKLLVARGADPTLRDAEHDGVAEGWAETAVTITNNPKCQLVADYLRSLR
jgi:ankyrin repeat protein